MCVCDTHKHYRESKVDVLAEVETIGSSISVPSPLIPRGPQGKILDLEMDPTGRTD
jgi:hypothetical protein